MTLDEPLISDIKDGDILPPDISGCMQKCIRSLSNLLRRVIKEDNGRSRPSIDQLSPEADDQCNSEAERHNCLWVAHWNSTFFHELLSLEVSYDRILAL